MRNVHKQSTIVKSCRQLSIVVKNSQAESSKASLSCKWSWVRLPKSLATLHQCCLGHLAPHTTAETNKHVHHPGAGGPAGLGEGGALRDGARGQGGQGGGRCSGRVLRRKEVFPWWIYLNFTSFNRSLNLKLPRFTVVKEALTACSGFFRYVTCLETFSGTWNVRNLRIWRTLAPRCLDSFAIEIFRWRPRYLKAHPLSHISNALHIFLPTAFKEWKRTKRKREKEKKRKREKEKKKKEKEKKEHPLSPISTNALHMKCLIGVRNPLGKTVGECILCI